MQNHRFLAPLLCLTAACGGSYVSWTGEPIYQPTPEENYKAGESQLKDDNYIEATKFFEHVKNKFPYSKYAALSELRIADAKFDQDKFLEAAEAYKSFVKLHPTHESADYASLRIGLSYLREAPGNFFLFPAAFERDQAQIHTAITHLEEFLRSYPQSKNLEEGKKALTEAQGRLADHAWYVAKFYERRKRWAGVAGRCEMLVRDYPGSRHEVEALFLMADAYEEMKERHRAQKALQQLVVKHPSHPRRPEAEKRLGALQK
jgi:outer membrane protein assembly factor BamD